MRDMTASRLVAPGSHGGRARRCLAPQKAGVFRNQSGFSGFGEAYKDDMFLAVDQDFRRWQSEAADVVCINIEVLVDVGSGLVQIELRVYLPIDHYGQIEHVRRIVEVQGPTADGVPRHCIESALVVPLCFTFMM